MESIKFLMIIFHSVIGVFIWRIESDVLDYRKIPFFCFHENKPYIMVKECKTINQSYIYTLLNSHKGDCL